MASKWSPIYKVKGYLRLIGGQRIQSPKGLETRPTSSRVREAVMNLLSRKINNSNWLDLFSGSGVMSCEALQRGAKKILAIERDKRTAEICKANLVSISKANKQKECIKVICNEVIKVLKEGCPKLKGTEDEDNRFDLVYLDPPYGANIYQSTLENLLQGNWLKQDSLVVCEHSSSVMLETPTLWFEKDRRTYGSSSLLFISPQTTSSPVLIPGRNQEAYQSDWD